MANDSLRDSVGNWLTLNANASATHVEPAAQVGVAKRDVQHRHHGRPLIIGRSIAS